MEVSMPTFQLGFAVQPPENGAEVLEQEVLAELAAELLMGESSSLYSALYEEGVIDSSFGSGYEELKGVAMLSAGGDSDEPERVLERILAENRRLQQEGPVPDSSIGSNGRLWAAASGIWTALTASQPGCAATSSRERSTMISRRPFPAWTRRGFWHSWIRSCSPNGRLCP